MEPDIYALSKAGFSKERIEEITRCDERHFMRKFLYVLLVSLLIFSFTACGSEKNLQGNGGGSMGTSVQESSEKDVFSQEENIPDAGQTSESEDGEKDQAASNILIVYFSRWGNTDYPDNVDAPLQRVLCLMEMGDMVRQSILQI